MKKISVIMPVHNTGILLKKSIETLEKQSFKSFELICVDDASNDAITLQILRQYECELPFCKVIYLEECLGAAEARNVGLEMATGEYVIFLDSDDEFDEFLLELMYDRMIQNEADICCCGYEEFYEDESGRHDLGVHFPKEYEDKTKEWFALNDLGETALTLWMSGPCKLFRRDFILENEIRFQTLPSSNDVYFSCIAAILARRICYTKCDKPLIFYRKNVKNQISANRNPGDLLEAVKWLVEDLERRKLCTDNLSKIVAFIYEHAIYELRTSHNEEQRRKFYYDLRDFINKLKMKIHLSGIEYLYFEDNLLRQEYETGWFWLMDDFQKQLEMEKDVLLERLKGYRKIVLWGRGKRGKAFQQFCRSNNIELVGVTDRSSRDVGGVTEYGFRIVDKKDVSEIVDLVVASNSEIYNFLRTEHQEIRCMDLSRYCPY